MATSSLRADEKFAVLKRDHVGWSGFVHELLVQRRDLPIRDNQNRNLAQLRQIRLLFPRQTKTKLECLSRELLKIDNVHRYFALKIAHGDFRDPSVNLRFHRNRRTLSNCLRSA